MSRTCDFPATFPNAVDYVKRGQLWVLKMEYEKPKIVAQGLYDRLQFKDPTKLQYVETLRQLSEVTDVKLFMRLRNVDVTQALKTTQE